MNTRFLTILSLLAFLAFSASAVAHPCPDPPDSHKHCRGGNDGDGERYYGVDVLFIDSGREGGGVLWQYDGRQIAYKGVNHHADAVAELDLDYFIAKFPELGTTSATQGHECFATGLRPLHAATFLKRRKSDAHGKFWFMGSTYHVPGEDRLDVLYLLNVDGEFSDSAFEGWPENGAGMLMYDWELKVENVGADIADRSCEGSGTNSEFMKVDFYPMPPPSP